MKKLLMLLPLLLAACGPPDAPTLNIGEDCILDSPTMSRAARPNVNYIKLSTFNRLPQVYAQAGDAIRTAEVSPIKEGKSRIQIYFQADDWLGKWRIYASTLATGGQLCSEEFELTP